MTVATHQPDNSPTSLVRRYQDDFAVVLPSHIKPATWCRVAIGALKRDPKLAEAANNDPASFLGALLDAARRGLEPGTEQYYLVPQKNKGRLEVRGNVGYQGIVELIYRAGAVSSVIVEVVRANDEFEYVPGRQDRPVHKVDWFGDHRGPLKGAYAYAVMKDGAVSKVVILNAEDITRAKRSSQGSDSAYSPWKNHEEAMWLKTAAHRLAKWVPTSAEYIREQIRAVRDVAAEGAPPESAGAVRPQPVVETNLEQAANPNAGDQYQDVDPVTGEVIEEQEPPAGQQCASYDESAPVDEEPKW